MHYNFKAIGRLILKRLFRFNPLGWWSLVTRGRGMNCGAGVCRGYTNTHLEACWVWSVAEPMLINRLYFQRPSISYGNTISLETHVDATQSRVFIGGRKVSGYNNRKAGYCYIMNQASKKREGAFLHFRM